MSDEAHVFVFTLVLSFFVAAVGALLRLRDEGS